MPIRLRLIVLCCVLIGPGAFARAADEKKSYTIKMERPVKVGDRFQVDALGAYRSKVIAQTDGKEPQTADDAAGIQLEGVCEIKEVAKDGRRTKVAFTVKVCSVMVGEKARPILPEGQVIEARWEKDETKYSVAGKDIPAELGSLFDLVLELPDPEGATDDEIFRTGEKKKVGDSWSIDPAVTSKEFKRIGFTVSADDLLGETTLQEANDAGDSPSIKIKSDFKAKSLTGPGRHPDAKLTLESGTLSVQSTTTLPLDEKAQPSKEEAKIVNTGMLTGTNNDGKKVRISRTTERVMERTTTRVAK